MDTATKAETDAAADAATDPNGNNDGEEVLELVTERVPMLGGAGRDAITGRVSTTGRDAEAVRVESWAEEYSGCEAAKLLLVMLLAWPVL